MNNDLISRSALKNEIDSWGCNDYDKYDFLDAIDNAPTVDTSFREVVAYECGQKSVEKPHGKWIDGFCNKCGGSSLCDGWGRDVESKFCPNCGACMIKEANDANN